MFERFTPPARQVIVLAQKEARELRHSYIGTEHILLGLLRERDGTAAPVLAGLGVTPDAVRAQVVEIVGTGEAAAPAGQVVPLTPRVKKVLELGLHEALRLGHHHIGTEHLLLGLVREGGGVAVHILGGLGAGPEAIRAATTAAAAPGGEATARGLRRSGPRPAPPLDLAVRVAPSEPLRRLLMAAAARALDDGRTETRPGDLLLALTADAEAAALLARLGVDEAAVRAAIAESG